MKELNFIVSLDTECDKGPKWQVRQPLSFTNILQGIPCRLQPVFEKYHLKPTYLLSPEVLINDSCVQLFADLKSSVELGTHLHSEFIYPDQNFASTNTNIIQNELEPEVEHKKLQNLTRLFKQKMGYAPKSFRAGRFGISRHTLGFLEDLEYKVDSSVVPNTWLYWNGKGANFLGAPNHPYHPSAQDFRKPGGMSIVEVPISTTNPFWEYWPKPLLRILNPMKRYQMIGINLLCKNRSNLRWLRPTSSDSETMLAVIDHLLNHRHVNTFCMMFHSNEATANTSPYNTTVEDVDRFILRLDEFFGNLFSNYRVNSIGLSEVSNLV